MSLTPSLTRALNRDLNRSLTRAGGGGSPWTPLSISGCELWLDATDADSISGTASLVTGWDDKSAAGNDVTATGTERPSQVTVNSLNAIRFETSELLKLASGGVTGLDGPDMTIFVVANKQFDEVDSWPGVISRGSGAWSAGWRMAASDAAGSNVYFSVQGYTTDNVLISSTATGADAFALWAADYVTSTTVKNGYLNNAFVAADTSGLIAGASSEQLTIGQPGEGNIYAMFGSIGEVIIYDSVLSSDDRLLVSVYLATKWGITLP